jgi:carnitine O-acetyltransferase
MAMYENQKALPRLPVPPLEQTLALYRRYVEPMVGAAAFARTQHIVDAFGASAVARQLHARIVAHAEDPAVANWLERWWSDSYLADRQTPCVNVSPVLGFARCARAAAAGQAAHAAVVAHLAARFHLLVASGALAPDTAKGNVPMCMDDYRMLFGAVRLPAAGRDVVVSHLAAPNAPPRHAVVMVNGRIFRLDVVAADGTAVPAPQLRRCLAAMLAAPSNSGTIEACVAALSALDREAWAAARGTLIAGCGANSRALATIESALFVVTLDDVAPAADSGDSLHCLVHGHTRAAITAAAATAGKALPHVNRWWDKSLMLHVGRGGMAGLTFEHSAMDSLPPLRLCEFIATSSAALYGDETLASGASAGSELLHEARFEVGGALAALVRQGQQRLVALVDALGLTVLPTPFGKDVLRTLGVSPDAFVQLCAQVAFQKLRGFVPSTYEAAGTKTFLHGRTETLRVVNGASQAFVEAYRDASGGFTARVPAGDAKRVADAMRAASGAHSASSRIAAAGQSCDRHLFGLLCAAKELGMTGDKLPAIFRDPSFATFGTIALSSTHPLPVPGVRTVGFGPVSSKGVGLAYFILPGEVLVCASSWRDGRCEEFAAEIKNTMAAMRTVLAAVPAPPRRKVKSKL